MDQLDLPARPTASPLNTSVKWGLIWGAIGIALSLIMQLMDINPFANGGLKWIFTVLSFGAAAFCVWKALVDHRDKELGGYIGLGRCVGVGALAGAISGLLSNLWNFVNLQFLNPAIKDQIKQGMMDAYEEQGMSEEQIEQTMKFMSWAYDPNLMMSILFGALFGALFGVVAGLIIGFVVKRERAYM